MKKFHLALSLCAILCLSAQADEKSSATDASKSKDSNTQSLGVIEVTSDSSTPSTWMMSKSTPVTLRSSKTYFAISPEFT